MLDRLTGDAAIIRSQQERIEELEEIVRQMQHQELACELSFYMISDQLDISARQARLLFALYQAPDGFLDHMTVREILNPEGDWVDPRVCAAVDISNMRKALGPFGIEVKVRRGHGYVLPADSRAIIKSKFRGAA